MKEPNQCVGFHNEDNNPQGKCAHYENGECKFFVVKCDHPPKPSTTQDLKIAG
jgi:hypothetical protein